MYRQQQNRQQKQMVPTPPTTNTPLNPPNMMGEQDGVLVFVDHRAPRDTPFDTPESLVHGDADNRTQKLPIASFFMTVALTNELGEAVAASGKGEVRAELQGGTAGGGGYSHAKVSVEKKVVVGKNITTDMYEVTVEFVPLGHDQGNIVEMEEGEITQEHIARSYLLGIGTHTSHIIETHSDDDKLYIHGMRKVIGHIGWAACGPAMSNVKMPIIPSGITISECLDIIQGMDLQVGKLENKLPSAREAAKIEVSVPETSAAKAEASVAEASVAVADEAKGFETVVRNNGKKRRANVRNPSEWRGPGTAMGKNKRSAACTGGTLIPAMKTAKMENQERNQIRNEAARQLRSDAEAAVWGATRALKTAPLWEEVAYHVENDVLIGMMDITVTQAFPVDKWRTMPADTVASHYEEKGFTSEGRYVCVGCVGCVGGMLWVCSGCIVTPDTLLLVQEDKCLPRGDGD
jgi:hypothetical protein